MPKVALAAGMLLGLMLSGTTSAQMTQSLPQLPMGSQRARPSAIPTSSNSLQIPSQHIPLRGQRGGEPQQNFDRNLSEAVTNYLHRSRLPYVDAKISVDSSGIATTAVLSGQVRTQTGKEDAEKKLRDFVHDANLRIDNHIELNPELASTRVPPPNQTQEIPLPPVFYGCWGGTSLASDDSEYLGGCERGYEVPTTYELCFRRVGAAGYEITHQSAASDLPEFQQHTTLASSDGAGHLTLKAFGSYRILGIFSSSFITFNDDSECDLVDGDRALMCHDTSLYRCDGIPWYREIGHLKMHRIN